MKEAWKSTSSRWSASNNFSCGGFEGSVSQMEGFSGMYGSGEDNGMVVRKRVMVVVDHTAHSKHAMMWALTHVANKGDLLTLLHIALMCATSHSNCYHSTYQCNSTINAHHGHSIQQLPATSCFD